MPCRPAGVAGRARLLLGELIADDTRIEGAPWGVRVGARAQATVTAADIGSASVTDLIVLAGFVAAGCQHLPM